MRQIAWFFYKTFPHQSVKKVVRSFVTVGTIMCSHTTMVQTPIMQQHEWAFQKTIPMDVIAFDQQRQLPNPVPGAMSMYKRENLLHKTNLQKIRPN